MSRESWTEAEGKARLGEAVANAALEGRRTVAKRGRKAVVSADAEEWERKCRRSGGLAAFLATSPLHQAGLEIDRSKDGLRDVEL